MIHFSKTFGLALGVMLAIAATAAPIALAQEGEFTANQYPATVTGEQMGTDVITTTAGSWSCPHTTYHGEVNEPTSSLTVVPSYTGCQAFGFFKFTIDLNGCDLIFKIDETEASDKYFGTTDIACPVNAEIVVTSAACVLRFPAQTGLGTMTYTNTTDSEDVEINISISSELKYTVDHGCATAAAGSYADGSYAGTATVTADDEEGNPTGVSISD
ncbi:MAG TPA: hypothetical protein VNP96_03555 [Solirubrobacterales bacterium]|nr:hypothetical protein [Solirubrobacterales bacterium]